MAEVGVVVERVAVLLDKKLFAVAASSPKEVCVAGMAWPNPLVEGVAVVGVLLNVVVLKGSR